VPEDPTCEQVVAELPNCTSTLIGAISYAKTVEAPAAPIAAGTILSHTVTVTNTGVATMPVAREDVLTDVLGDATIAQAPASDNESVTSACR
jgi:hypothetical protein